MHRLTLVFLLLASGAAYAAPRVGHGAPIVQGKLAASTIVRMLKKADAKLLACYKKDPAATDGTSTASFTIEPDGKLASVAVSSIGLTPVVDTCLSGVLSKIKFRKQPGPIVVIYPLSFVSGKRGPITKQPQVRLGLPTVKGDLDKAIVQRYVKRSIQKLTYCYEKQLLVDEKLAGTVAMQFTINSEGAVRSATASGMDEVALCIQTALTQIAFPKMRTSEVTVSYPVTFSLPVAEKLTKKKKPRAKK